MANNPFSPEGLGLLASLRAEPRGLLDYIAPPTPKPGVSALVDALMDRPNPALPISSVSGAANDLLGSTLSSPQNRFGNLPPVPHLFPPPTPPPPVTSY